MTPSMLTAQEARRQAETCARRIRVCMDAGEYDEARHQLAEAKRLTLLAIELDRKELAA